MPIGYPLVNGVRFDASSIELKINLQRYIGITQVQYEQSLEPGEVRGLNPQVLGYTRGLYRVSGTISMLREEFQDLTTNFQTVVVGLLEANVVCSVTYSELPRRRSRPAAWRAPRPTPSSGCASPARATSSRPAAQTGSPSNCRSSPATCW
jgi:hypothetical protein